MNQGDDGGMRIEIQNPRSLLADPVEAGLATQRTWHSPVDEDVMIMEDEQQQQQQQQQPQVVEEESWNQSNDPAHLLKVISLLRAELAGKDKMMRNVIKSNAENVKKATQHIEKLEKSFQTRLQQAQEGKSSQATQIRDLTSAIIRQNAEMAALKEKLKSRPGGVAAAAGRSQDSHQLQQQPSPPEVFYPSANEMRDNGIFVLRENSAESVLCVKLPLAVEVKDDGDKVLVADDDIASVSKMKVGKRQTLLTKVVELLFNPLDIQMSPARSQHLIWILLLNVFNKYGFKDPDDKYLLRPHDFISLKPELVIKSHRPDLAPAVLTLPGVSKEVKSRELDVTKRLQTVNGGKTAKQSAPPPAPAPSDIPSPASATSTISTPILRTREEDTCSSLLGPKSKTTLPVDACLRDVTLELQLLRSARWNSANGRVIFNEQNRRYLHSVVPCHVPGVSDLKQKMSHILVGFIRSQDSNGQIVYLPFLVMPKKDARDNSQPVRSSAIQGFNFGEVFDSGKKLVCPICSLGVPEAAMSAHTMRMHGTDVDVRVRAVPMASSECLPRGRPAAAKNKLWTFRVAPGSHSSFASLDSQPIFYFMEQTDQVANVVVKKEVLQPDEIQSRVFKCRFCPKAFTTTCGWDCHVDSAHSHLKSFKCPTAGCVFCCGTKMALLYHVEYGCEEAQRGKRAEGLFGKKHFAGGASKRTATSSASSCSSTPKLARIESSPSPVTLLTPPTSRRQLRVKVSVKTEEDEIEDQLDHSETSSEGRRLRAKRSLADTPDSAAAAAAVANNPESIPKPPENSNKLKRRQKHPQVAFTALLKEIVLNINSYVVTSKIILWKERRLSLNKRAFRIIELEDKVDDNAFCTVKDFSDCFRRLCEDAAAKNEGDETVAEVSKDLIQFGEGELLIRRVELERLEKEINPMLSEDKGAAFKHTLLKILEEVKSMRITHVFEKPVTKQMYPDYFDKVKQPICLQQIYQKAQQTAGGYGNKKEFLDDFSLMHANCLQYFGRSSEFTRDARTILTEVKALVEKYRDFMVD